MSTLIWTLISKICWAFLSLRYSIRIKGLKELRQANLKQGILFFPNHPAHMDPLFLFILLWPRFRMRPIVVEYIFRLSMLKPLMRLIRAIPIPNFDSSINQLKVKKANDAVDEIVKGLKRGENFVFYPSGKLKNSGKEILGGSSGAHALVKEYPQAQIVLVRTTGLWGSSFSRAILGKSPPLPQTLLHGLITILKNGIFFAPRRNIEIEIALCPKELPRQGERLEFNRFLENWYNRYKDEKGKEVDTEPLTLVSYSFWKKDLPEIYPTKSKKGMGGETQASDETKTKVFGEIRRILNQPGIEIRQDMDLAVNLGMDSLNIAEMIAFLSKHYRVEEIHPEDVVTVQDLLEIAEGAKGSERKIHQLGGPSWPNEPNRPPPTLPLGKTIPEAFLNSAERMRNFSACGDDLVGVFSFKRMKKAVLVLGLHFRTLPGKNIAVLLPASAAAYLVILALQFAGKTPVMLNWTLGSRYLDEMMRASDAKTVISSWRFLERLSHVEFGSLIDKIQLLEDIREKLTLTTKLRGLFLSFSSNRSILQSLKLDQVDENSSAVILFTSGTEANPKGVPLSHKNILSNLRSAMQCIHLSQNDVLYGVLPPFHSFGFSVVGLFPLCAGIKVAFYPDPTDSFALAEGISRWKITLFCSPPSFLKGLFSAAKPEQLKTMRLFISGAEKAPKELYERVESLGTHAKLIEGYGITECSPILTLTRINLPPKGVGQLLPDIELCTIHVETQELLPAGGEGEVCVRGPNIFSGYLGNPRDPFIEIEGKKWYRTGDIGKLDEEGSLILSGRIKRFTKIGGEMISLGGIEEAIANEFLKSGKISKDVPSLAVIANEKVEGQPQLILFSTISVTREEVNRILHEQGFSRLVKIASVRKIDEIPLMGTGKTNYRGLEKQLDSNRANGNAA